MKHILQVEGLCTTFHTEAGQAPAVLDLSFEMAAGETLAIVGESGCGKSVTALSILGLIPNPPGRIEAGRILYRDRDLLTLSKKQLRAVRGKDIAMIFQEPMTSLNPVFTVGSQIMSSLIIHEKMTKARAREEAVSLLAQVGIAEPERVVSEYPHQLSGGMRQRAMIAMALACKPSILIADEPTTALDVTIQAQILRLLSDLHAEHGMSILLITHDMGIVAQLADHVLVMYAGEAIEYQKSVDLFRRPRHPYTSGLMNSIPSLVEEKERLYNIPGTVPAITAEIKGCRFAERCAYAQPLCFAEKPMYEASGEDRIRCHYPLH